MRNPRIPAYSNVLQGFNVPGTAKNDIWDAPSSTIDNDEQYANVPAPISLSLGNSGYISPHFLKAELPVTVQLGNEIVLRLEQPSNARAPTDVHAGKLTCSSAVH